MKTSFRTLPLNAREYSSFSLLLSQCYADEDSPSLHLFDIIDLGYGSAVTFWRRHLPPPVTAGYPSIFVKYRGKQHTCTSLCKYLRMKRENTQTTPLNFQHHGQIIGRGFVVHSNASWKIVIYPYNRTGCKIFVVRSRFIFCGCNDDHRDVGKEIILTSWALNFKIN